MTGPDRPGPARIAVLVAVGVALVVVLFVWVFPWIERNLANPTMGASGRPVPAAAAGG